MTRRTLATAIFNETKDPDFRSRLQKAHARKLALQFGETFFYGTPFSDIMADVKWIEEDK